MIKEFNNYITREYNTLLNISNKMTKNDSYAGDLLNDVLVQIYDKKELKLRTLDDNSIKYYIVAIMRINWFSKTSPFFRKVKRESALYNELSLVKEIVQQEDSLEEHKLMDLMEEEWAELDYFRKIIFEKYMVMGSLKRVSKDTTIPLTSIARYVNTAKEDIKHNIFKKMN
jgi:hypothetical protein